MSPPRPAAKPQPPEGSSRWASVALFGFVPVLAAAFLGTATPARADGDDEDDGGRPELMREPITFTDVVDAFDDEDIFDLNLTVGFTRTWELGRIQRQYACGDPLSPCAAGTSPTGDSRMSGDWRDIANYERGVNHLNLGLDIGVFRDLAVYVRLPLLLSDDRSL